MKRLSLAQRAIGKMLKLQNWLLTTDQALVLSRPIVIYEPLPNQDGFGWTNGVYQFLSKENTTAH